MTASACKGIIRNMSLAELPRANREPGFYLEHRVRDAWTQALFIDSVRDGGDKAEAATEAGTTATKMRALRKRDSAFRNLYDDAMESYQSVRRNAIRRNIWDRAMDKEDPASPRLLVLLSEAHLPEMGYKRTKHIAHDNPLQVQQIPFIDPAKLDEMPIDEREALAAALRKVMATGEPVARHLRDVSAG